MWGREWVNFVGYLAVGYAPVLVITDLAAVSCDCAVVAVEFATVGVEVAETEVVVGVAVVETEVVVGIAVVETEVVVGIVVGGAEVAETGIDNFVFADAEGFGIATAGTEGSD